MIENLSSDPVTFAISVGLATALGLVVGSFLNVVIWRLPRGESIVSPPSACPTCATRIRWYDNIPVFSWVMLTGKCRTCKAGIAVRYPLVELLTGVVFFGLAWKFLGAVSMNPLAFAAFVYLGAIGVALTFIDLDTHKLPNKIVLPAYVVVPVLLLVANVIQGWDTALAVRTLAGGAVLYLFYFVLCLVGGMGFGDVKLAGVLGFSLGWLGWEHVVIGGFLPFVIGGVFSIGLLVFKRANRKSGIPFGPWMILGWFVSLFVSERLSEWYLKAFIW